MANPLRVLSVYDGFFSGGARILHTEVIKELKRRGQVHRVLSINATMTREATLQPMAADRCHQELIAAGIPVETLGRFNSVGAGRVFSLSEIARTKALIEEADIILTLKEQPLDLLAQAGIGTKPVVACLHRSDPANQSEREDEFIDLMSSHNVTAITCSGHTSKAAYVAAGLPEAKVTAITNGVDLARFRPSRAVRAVTRYSFGLTRDAKVVLFVARYDTMKNIPLFLASAARFLAAEPNGHIIMAGAGMKAENEALIADLREHFAVDPTLVERVHLAGVQSAMERLYAAADVIALTSAFGETFPLALVEGLSCGAVPVSTNVGDSQILVGDRGIITPSDPGAIAGAWCEAIRRRRYYLKRIIYSRDGFSNQNMFDQYERVFIQAARKQGTGAELSVID